MKEDKEKQDRIMARYEKTLEIFEKENNGLEDKFYSKFLPFLNAKKEEILRLRSGTLGVSTRSTGSTMGTWSPGSFPRACPDCLT